MDQTDAIYEKKLLEKGYIIKEESMETIDQIDTMYSVDMTPVQYAMYKKRLLEMGYAIKEDSIINDGDIVINMTVQRPDHSFLSPDEVEQCLYPILNDEYSEEELEDASAIFQVIQLSKRAVKENKNDDRSN